jgi:hypothetical protein
MPQGFAARASNALLAWSVALIFVVALAFYSLNFHSGPVSTLQGAVVSASVLPSDDPAPQTVARVRLPDGQVVTANVPFHGLPTVGSLVSVRVYRQAITGGVSYELAPRSRRK